MVTLQQQKTWYVYFLCDPDMPDIPFYIGKGTGDRMYHHLMFHSSAMCNVQKMQTIRQIMADGKQVLCRVVAEFTNELDAYIYEWAMIAVYHEHITNVAHSGSTCIHERAARVKRQHQMPSHEEVFSVNEAALLLNLHPQTVSEMARTGQIRAGRVGRQYRIRQSEIDRILGGSAQRSDETR